MWRVFQPFSNGLWLTIIGMCVAFAVTIFLLERANDSQHGATTHLIDLLYFAIGALMGNSERTTSLLAARVIVLAWYFLQVVLVAMYTADLASTMVASAMQVISGPSDLPGRVVITPIGNENVVKGLGSHVMPMQWYGDDDLDRMIDAVRAGTASAIVIGEHINSTTTFRIWSIEIQYDCILCHFDVACETAIQTL